MPERAISVASRLRSARQTRSFLEPSGPQPPDFVLQSVDSMAQGTEGGEASTPKASSAQKPSSQSNKSQKSILGFFQKKAASSNSSTNNGSLPKPASKPLLTKEKSTGSFSLTPAPSSDGLCPPSSPAYRSQHAKKAMDSKDKENGLPSPATTAGTEADEGVKEVLDVANGSSASRKVGLLQCISRRRTQLIQASG